jgi:hypothetical protein
VLTEAPKTNKVRENCLYLKPNSNWTKDNARFAAYFCKGSKGEKWVNMTKVGDDGWYEVEVPGTVAEYKTVIFCRMNPGSSVNNWDNRWNQTGDLTWSTAKNAYTIAAGAWSNGNGTWSKITEY